MLANLLLLALWLCLGTGCRTAVPLPAADFSTPGWQVQSGQAVWQPPGRRPELAGDLLFATNANGNCFIQFSKMPFSMVTARISNGRWLIEFGGNQHLWQGQGAPPDHFAWFQLPRALLGANPPGNWHFTRLAGASWRLANSRTGEELEGVFSP